MLYVLISVFIVIVLTIFTFQLTTFFKYKKRPNWPKRKFKISDDFNSIQAAIAALGRPMGRVRTPEGLDDFYKDLDTEACRARKRWEHEMKYGAPRLESIRNIQPIKLSYKYIIPREKLNGSRLKVDEMKIDHMKRRIVSDILDKNLIHVDKAINNLGDLRITTSILVFPNDELF